MTCGLFSSDLPSPCHQTGIRKHFSRRPAPTLVIQLGEPLARGSRQSPGARHPYLCFTEAVALTGMPPDPQLFCF